MPSFSSSFPAPPPTRWIDLGRLAAPGLAASFHGARPFPHLIIEDLVLPERRAELLDAFGEEPCTLYHDEIYEHLASATALEHPVLQSFRDELGGEAARAILSGVTGKRLARIEMRAFGYEAGHYLLPHSDHQTGVGRALAFAYYLDTPSPPSGGELELFECDLDPRGRITATRSAVKIAPRPNRIVIFDVGDASLHQVTEVTRGARFSLSGWFYP